MTTACPTPTKARYATRRAAENAANIAGFALDKELHPYECACTWWHLSKSPPAPLPDPADATHVDIARLRMLPDIDFREIVAADARDEGTTADRAALRNPPNLKRWRSMLGQLSNDIGSQLAARRGDTSLAGHDWRRRAVTARDSLQIRLSECQRLRAEAHADLMAKHDAKRQQAELALASGASAKELRAHAGELAIQRLIDAHGTEFSIYLAEEFELLGLEVPERVARWARAAPAPAQPDQPHVRDNLSARRSA